ncbi:MAG TPA: TIGR03619 family F420-dependent LLM class oxidoreductase, partial [Jatrophihabitantaceae bacterium]
IIVLPLHNPVLLAKELASVDVVSGGRLTVGVAAGYMPAEFASVGVPMAGRQTRVDEYVQALRALWTMEHPSFHGRHVSFEGIDAYPRPVQRAGPPVVVGGEGPAALTRALTLADGWYGFSLDVDATRDRLDQLRRLGKEHDRPAELGPLEITVTPYGSLDRDVVARYEELGVHRLVLLPEPEAVHAERHRPVPLERILANIDRAARDLLSR